MFQLLFCQNEDVKAKERYFGIIPYIIAHFRENSNMIIKYKNIIVKMHSCASSDLCKLTRFSGLVGVFIRCDLLANSTETEIVNFRLIFTLGEIWVSVEK